MSYDRYALRAACFFGVCVFALSAQVMPPGLSSIGAEFGLGESAQGMMLALQYAGFLVTSVVGGGASDRWGRKPLLVVGMYLTAAGLALAPLAGSAWTFAAAMILIGIGGGLVETLVSLLIADLFPERRAREMNRSQIFYTVGAISMPFAVGAMLRAGWEWRPGFWIAAAAALGCGVWFHLLRAPGPAPRRGKSGQSRATAPTGEGAVVLILGLMIFFYVGAEMVVGVWAPSFLEKGFGIGKDWAAYGLSLYWLCMMAGRMAYVALVERWSYMAPVIVSALAGAAASFFMSLAGQAWLAYVGVGLTGLSLAGTWATIMAYGAKRFQERTGLVLGVLMASGSLGLVVFPWLAGAIAEASPHGLRAGLMLAPALLLGLGALAAWLLARDRREARG